MGRAWSARQSLLAVGIVDAVTALSPIADKYFGDAFLSVGLGIAAVTTLVGLLDYAGRSETSFDLRDALAVSVMVVWLMLVAQVAFFAPSQANTDGTTSGVASPEQLRATTQQMLGNFTTVVGLVVAFYFGGKSVERVVATRTRRQVKDSPAEQAEPQ